MTVTPELIEQGIAQDQFLFHYQPKISLLNGKPSGAEALLRWLQPDGTLTPPADFIPIAEDAGLLPRLTAHMFPHLLRDYQQIRALHEPGSESPIALNVSASDLDGTRLLRLVRDAIGEGQIGCDQLQLEITEGVIVAEGNQQVDRTLTGLVAAGVKLAMDDFGTGFSSMNTLNRLPFSTIKLDQSFVRQMERSMKSATLIKASISMAEMLGIKTVIEGIETEQTYHALLHSGCNEAQGYWISKPLPLEGYIAFLNSRPSWPCSPVGMLRMAQLTHTWQHKLMVDSVLSLLSKDSAERTDALEQLHMDHTECSLGRWYYGEGQHFADNPDFVALEAPHQCLHDSCNRIFEAVRDGAGPDRLLPLLETLGDHSGEVHRYLHRLETRCLLESFQNNS